MRKGLVVASALVFGVLAAGLWRALPSRVLSPEALQARFATPLPPPDAPVATYHLGHSLVGRDMPAMLAQLAGHDHASQLGWGASLKDHWTGQIAGFESENSHPHFRAAAEAVESGSYPVVVLTEMVEIKDAIAYHDSARHLALWAKRIRAAQPDARLYLYETWHRLDDPDGWLNRIDADLETHWEGTILAGAMATDGVGTIHVIPGGQVKAAVVRAIDAGKIPGLTSRTALFATDAQGLPDLIHFNDLGAYLMALTHYAVIYHRSPVGLPHALTRADGSPITPIAPETAEALQRIVWDTVAGYALSGVSGG